MNGDWYFYILRCRDNSLYCGVTNDLEARVKDHNSGKGSKYTYSHRPVNLVYNEKCRDGSEARKREAEVKNWTKTRKEHLIIQNRRLQ